MKFFAASILLGFLMSGCGRQNRTGQQFVGTWQHEGGFSMTFLADGSFSSNETNTHETVLLAFQGTWLAKDGYLTMIATNASGTQRHMPVGSIDRFKVIEVDGNHLTIKSGDQTLSYTKKVTDDPAPERSAQN